MAFRRKKPAPEPVNPFHITVLKENETPPPPRETTPVLAPRTVFASRFHSPADALTFLAAVRDDGARRFPPTLRGPDQAIWVVVNAYGPADVELSWALGGVVHLPDGPDLVSPRGRRQRWDAMQAWPSVSWVELATSVAPGTGVPEQPEVVVVTTGSLARWIIDRFQSSDLDIRVATARLTALFTAEATDWTAIMLRVTGHGRSVPKAFASALTGLPHTVVCRLSGGHLLIDQRLSLPLLDADFARFVPEGQEWLLAGDLGAWRVTERSPEYVPPLRVNPALQTSPAPPPPGRLPADLGVEVSLVRDDQPHATDALLLSDDDLQPLRLFLTGHPAAERAFLVLGPGRHVYAEPGHAVSDIPFGVPLRRLGPGALFQEIGYRLKPALPSAARARLFAVDDQSLVVLQAGETHRLSLRSTVPVWSLWLGPSVDAVAQPLSATAQDVLAQVDAAEARLEPPPELTADLPSVEQSGLVDEGFQLEQRGALAEAARKYWEAGQPALAARLYEQAAEAER